MNGEDCYRDFDRAFSPAIPVIEGRCKRIILAFHQGEKLPPVNLYKIGGAYFVPGSNHRVSKARYHGIAFMEAELTEPLPWLSETTGSASSLPSARRVGTLRFPVLRSAGALGKLLASGEGQGGDKKWWHASGGPE